MQRLVFSTNDVPEAERFSYWRETVHEGLIGVSGERDKDQEIPFSARLEASIGECFVRFRYRADRTRILRLPRHIARRAWDDHLLLYREASAGAWFNHDRHEFVTRPGDLALIDATIPFATEARESYNQDLLLIPRSLLEPHLPVSLRARSLTLTGSSGVAGMVKTYFDAFAGQIDSLDEREVAFVADNFSRLLAVACGAAAGEHKESIRAARLEEAKRYIGLHLADPELMPEKAAGALRISVRQLHVLFEPSGTTFGQYVLRRRLEECRAALMNPIGSRSVTDVAFAWGFNNLWTFNRNFRRAFGVTPGEMRGDAPAPGLRG